MLNYTLKFWMVAMVCALLLTGCITTKNLLGPGNYGKDIVPHDKTAIKDVWAAEDNGELKVSGKLRLKGMMRVSIPDYVEVALLDRGGEVIAAQKVSYYPRTLTGRKRNKAAVFSARFAEMPPVGTTIRLRNTN